MSFCVTIYKGDIMYFLYNDNNYEIVIERKNNKNIYIRVREDLKIHITCSYLYTNMQIKKLIMDNEDAIKNMIDKQANKINKEKEYPNCYLGNNIDVVYCNIFNKPKLDNNKLFVKDIKELNKWYLNEAKIIFKERLDIIYSLFKEDIPYPKLKIRQMKTRWGVCNRRDNSVTLNLELVRKDVKYLDYVIVHELSHFIHFNHSSSFWSVVEKYNPNYKKIRKELKD